MMRYFGLRRLLAFATAASLVLLLIPVAVTAHSDLESSEPAQGVVVPAPFAGPIVLTFSEDLADGSKADLIGPDGATIAKAVVDGAAKTMTFTLTTPLDPGAYEVHWVSIADDGDVLRQPVVKFSVAAAPSPSPSPSPSPTPSPTPTPSPPAASASASAAPPSASAAATVAASATPPSTTPTPAPSADSATAGSGGDVVLPIVVALIVLAGGAFYLFSRRNRPPDAT